MLLVAVHLPVEGVTAMTVTGVTVTMTGGCDRCELDRCTRGYNHCLGHSRTSVVSHDHQAGSQQRQGQSGKAGCEVRAWDSGVNSLLHAEHLPQPTFIK
jgi:hypothetical protein